MTQISRPFQIALLAMGLFAAVWFVALRGQSGSTGGSGSTPASSSAAQAGKATAPGATGSAAAPTPIYHGAAPGVAGLTRAIAKAHEAVATSQQNAKQLEQHSAQASGDTGTSTAGSTTANQPTASSNTTAGAGAHPANKHVAAPAAAGSGAASHGANAPTPRSTKASPPPMQLAVESELKQGKIATILFWNPRSTVDESVHRELEVAASAFDGKVAIHNARALQVGSFGKITRAVQVYQTPTILIVNPQGQATTLTGLEDAFSIQQAIAEARRT